MNNQIQKVEQSKSAFELAQREAKALASCDIVPDLYRNNIPNTMIALEYAHRTGASALAVMQNLYIVHGKPAFEAKFLIGVVNSCGKWSSMKYKYDGQEDTPGWSLPRILH